MKQESYVERFLDKLWAERGLSDNSLQGYRHDLRHLSERLRKRGRDPRITLRSTSTRRRASHGRLRKSGSEMMRRLKRSFHASKPTMGHAGLPVTG